MPFPFSRPVEASIMGGANWKDNGDGTFTQLASGTMNPASGFSYLELYLMGFLPASKVPDFFILRNQQNVGRTPEGQNIVKAEKVTITIQDVIAHNGPRVPSFENSPKALQHRDRRRDAERPAADARDAHAARGHPSGVDGLLVQGHGRRVDDVDEHRAVSDALWVGLENVVETHRAAPRTFSIPRADQRSALRVGDLVKLVFRADPPSPDGLTAERMWVEVREVLPHGFVGALDNQPSFIRNLKPGDRIAFGPEHVAALHGSPTGLELPYGQFARVSLEVAQGGWPVDAHREPPEGARASGWVVRGSAGDAPGFVQMLIDDLLQHFRVLDSVLDEPVGSRWVWDEALLEYVAPPKHQPEVGRG